MCSTIDDRPNLLVATEPVLEPLLLQVDVPPAPEPRPRDCGCGVVLGPQRSLDLRGQRAPGPASGAEQAGAPSGVALENRDPTQGFDAQSHTRYVVELLVDRERPLD